MKDKIITLENLKDFKELQDREIAAGGKVCEIDLKKQLSNDNLNYFIKLLDREDAGNIEDEELQFKSTFNLKDYNKVNLFINALSEPDFSFEDAWSYNAVFPKLALDSFMESKEPLPYPQGQKTPESGQSWNEAWSTGTNEGKYCLTYFANPNIFSESYYLISDFIEDLEAAGWTVKSNDLHPDYSYIATKEDLPIVIGINMCTFGGYNEIDKIYSVHYIKLLPINKSIICNKVGSNNNLPIFEGNLIKKNGILKLNINDSNINLNSVIEVLNYQLHLNISGREIYLYNTLTQEQFSIVDGPDALNLFKQIFKSNSGSGVYIKDVYLTYRGGSVSFDPQGLSVEMNEETWEGPTIPDLVTSGDKVSIIEFYPNSVRETSFVFFYNETQDVSYFDLNGAFNESGWFCPPLEMRYLIFDITNGVDNANLMQDNLMLPGYIQNDAAGAGQASYQRLYGIATSWSLSLNDGVMIDARFILMTSEEDPKGGVTYNPAKKYDAILSGVTVDGSSPFNPRGDRFDSIKFVFTTCDGNIELEYVYDDNDDMFVLDSTVIPAGGGGGGGSSLPSLGYQFSNHMKEQLYDITKGVQDHPLVIQGSGGSEPEQGGGGERGAVKGGNTKAANIDSDGWIDITWNKLDHIIDNLGIDMKDLSSYTDPISAQFEEPEGTTVTCTGWVENEYDWGSSDFYYILHLKISNIISDNLIWEVEFVEMSSFFGDERWFTKSVKCLINGKLHYYIPNLVKTFFYGYGEYDLADELSENYRDLFDILYLASHTRSDNPQISEYLETIDVYDGMCTSTWSFDTDVNNIEMINVSYINGFSFLETTGFNYVTESQVLVDGRLVDCPYVFPRDETDGQVDFTESLTPRKVAKMALNNYQITLYPTFNDGGNEGGRPEPGPKGGTKAGSSNSASDRNFGWNIYDNYLGQYSAVLILEHPNDSEYYTCYTYTNEDGDNETVVTTLPLCSYNGDEPEQGGGGEMEE